MRDAAVSAVTSTVVRLGDYLTKIEAGASFRCDERPPLDNEVGVVKVSAVTWGVYDEDESKTVRDGARVVKRHRGLTPSRHD